MKRVAVSRRKWMLGALASCAAPWVRAVPYPDRPLRVYVGFSPGSPSDLLARGLAEKLPQSLAQPVIVENKPGAGGLLSVRALLSAPADGYSLLVVSAAYAALPVITTNPGFDPKELAGITRIANVPSVLVAHPSVGATSVAQLVTKLQYSLGALNYATPGKGSANHFAAEYFLAKTGVRATHVPYRGVPESVTAVLAGECQFAFVPVPNALELIRNGRLIGLAISSAVRSRVLPNVPTVAEAGVTGYVFDPWFGLLVHANTPETIRTRLIQASTAALNAAGMRQRFDPIGAEISPLAGAQFDAYIQAEIAKFRFIAVTARIEAT
jgi:tripartite-type tricarboxylate transporter receptor subunit TctC